MEIPRPRHARLTLIGLTLLASSASLGLLAQAETPSVPEVPSGPAPVVAEPCLEHAEGAEASLEAVFDNLRNLQSSRLPGPAGTALRARKAQQIASAHLDVDAFARGVLRGLWANLDEPRREAWTKALRGLLRHRYVERIRDPRKHILRILSSELRCDHVRIRVSLRHTTRRSTSALEFRLRKADGGWRVYDVALEGASLVSSWRGRLTRVFRESGIAGLDVQLTRLTRRYTVER
jgi:ABC-type transporter MlaC component